MNPLRNWKFWTITGSAMLGSLYGLVATLRLNPVDVSVWGVLVPVVCGAALCASAASAVCRAIETLKLIRESQNRPTDHTLCYRGIRYLAPFHRSSATFKDSSI